MHVFCSLGKAVLSAASTTTTMLIMKNVFAACSLGALHTQSGPLIDPSTKPRPSKGNMPKRCVDCATR